MTNESAGGDGRRVLATDLDGTLIPLGDNEQNSADLRTLAEELEQSKVTLVFVTGRHFESVSNAIKEFQLPNPDWVICDVGTSILGRKASGAFAPIEAYYQHQDEIITSLPILALRQQLQAIAGLRLQEDPKQRRFKLSFYADATRLDDLVRRIQEQLDRIVAPYSIIHSVDPFNGDGLIDLLPREVSKAHALAWWVQHTGTSPDAIVVAGDSGNDLAALTAGYRSIVVGNADRQLAQSVYNAHHEAGWNNRLYLARQAACSGVMEGCRWFGLLERPDPAPSLPLGATPVSHNETHFRVWAPQRQRVAVEVIDHGTRTRHALARQENGYFAGNAPVGSNALYQYVLDDVVTRPDPASRHQPDGVHGASQIVDPAAFPWTDQDWKGVQKSDLIIYELHMGTFTQDGTFRAAIERLPELVDLGVTAIEIMPVAQSPGRWNWGYDGVDLFAVRNTYGGPDGFKAYIDVCHTKGIAVILDVVFNHLGPEGNYLADFGPYFSRKHRTPWGEAFNFDGRHSQQVRQFVVDNTIHWLDEYHLDGLRLDAVHLMLDDSKPTIHNEIREAVANYSETTDRLLHLIAEANVYDRDLLPSEDDRSAYDAIWCDCLMHSVYSHAVPDLQLTHRTYDGAMDLADVLRHGYLYVFTENQPVRVSDGQRSAFHQGETGQPHIASFVTALQTHDSVGNHPHGKRLHHLTSKAFQKAAAALTMLYPSIPMIFMGEESATDSPFPFFVDFEDPQLLKAVDEGRAREYPQHAWKGALSPSDPQAFHRSKCHNVAAGDTDVLTWYRTLIAFRKQGISEGWLATDRMTTSYEPERDIFALRYCRDDGRHVTVQARLTNTTHRRAETVRVPLEGTLLLSSEPNPVTSDGQITVRRNHVVISQS